MPSFTINRESFSKALVLCKKVVPAKGARACLRCVKLDFGDNSLMITASDLETSIEVVCEIESKGKAILLLPCDLIHDIVTQSECEDIAVDVEKALARVTCGFDEFEVLGMLADDFPEFKGYSDEDPTIKTDSKVLAKALERALVTAKPGSEGRYSVAGVCLRLKKPSLLHAVATSGRQLLCANVACESSANAKEFFDRGNQNPCLMPHKVASLLKDVCQGEPIELIGKENTLYAKTGNVCIMGLLATQIFPQYEMVMNKMATDKEARIEVDKFKKAVDRAARFCNEETRGLILRFTEKKLSISASSSDKGRSRVEIDCNFETADGEPHEIIIMSEIALDGAKTHPSGETIVFEMGKPEAPLSLRHKEFVFILCPINTKEQAEKAAVVEAKK